MQRDDADQQGQDEFECLDRTHRFPHLAGPMLTRFVA
jgi:hypothetical protein